MSSLSSRITKLSISNRFCSRIQVEISFPRSASIKFGVLSIFSNGRFKRRNVIPARNPIATWVV